jgi:hypothetical protein
MSEAFDVPSATELLEAVEEWLATAVVPGTTGQLSFHARVAGNVLAKVRRELELGPALAEARRQRLGALGYAAEVDLAAAIRSGDLDDRWDEVLAAVRETVHDRLSVANPAYLA